MVSSLKTISQKERQVVDAAMKMYLAAFKAFPFMKASRHPLWKACAALERARRARPAPSATQTNGPLVDAKCFASCPTRDRCRDEGCDRLNPTARGDKV